MNKNTRTLLLVAELNTFGELNFEKAFLFLEHLSKENIQTLLDLNIWSNHNKYNNLVQIANDDFKPRSITEIEKVQKRLHYLSDNYETIKKDSLQILEEKRKEVL